MKNREIASKSKGDLNKIVNSEVPAISMNHFKDALESVLPTVSQSDLQRYIDWNTSYGSFRRMI